MTFNTSMPMSNKFNAAKVKSMAKFIESDSEKSVEE